MNGVNVFGQRLIYCHKLIFKIQHNSKSFIYVYKFDMMYYTLDIRY